MSPSVSVAMCRLRPVICFPGVVAARSILLYRFHTLAVDDRCRGLGRVARLLPALRPKSRVNPPPRFRRAARVESSEEKSDTAADRKASPPRVAVHVEVGTHNVSARIERRPPAGSVLRQGAPE